MANRLSLLFVLALAVSAAEDCGINCLLKLAAFHIPDQTFADAGVALTGIACSGLSATGASAGAVSAAGLPVSFSGVATLDCTASYTVGDATGTATLTGTAQSVAATVKFVRAADGVVESVAISECAATGAAIVCDTADTEDAKTAINAALSAANYAANLFCSELSAHAAAQWTEKTKSLATTIRHSLNNATFPDPPASPGSQEGITNLTESAVVNVVNWAVNDLVKAEGASAALNAVVNTSEEYIVSNNQYTDAVLGGNFMAGDIFFIYKMSDGFFRDFGNFTVLKTAVVAPEDDQTIVTEVSLADLEFDLNYYVTTWDGYMFNGSVGLHLKNPYVKARTRILVNNSFLTDITEKQALQWGCYVSAIKSVLFTQIYFNATGGENAFWDIKTGTVEPEFLDATNAFIQYLVDSYLPSTAGLVNEFYAPHFMQKINILLMTVFSGKNDWNCTPSEPDDYRFERSNDTLLYWPMVYAAPPAALVCYLAIILAIRCTSHKKEKTVGFGEPINADDQHKKEDDGPSMFMNDNIPLFVRYFVPFLVFVNIAAFLISNAAASTSVYPAITLGDREMVISSLFDFGLINTITDMWKAKVYPLAILVGFFSGAWPYMKLIMMLVCWFLPPSKLAPRKRELFLMALDALGKWSFIDTFVMCLMMVSFHIDVQVPAGEVAPGSRVELFVGCKPGFVIFVGATMLSLVSSHIIVALHRYLARKEKREETQHLLAGLNREDRPVALCNIAFKSGMREAGKTFMKVLITFLILFTLVAIAVGDFTRSLIFDMRGLVGFALNLIGQESVREYSVFDMAVQATQSLDETEVGYAWFIAVVFGLITIVLPLLQMVLLLVLWLVPMRYKAQRAMMVVCEVINAWASIDVYTVSCIVSLLQLRQFAQFIVGDKCDFINPLIEQYMSEPLDGYTTCFDVFSRVGDGSWTLLAATVTYLFSSIFVMRKCHSALEARM